ncbi:L-type lectin-domain containing receptor kinase VIII.1-like [Typha latifolia]|uniref:L-type lectin-domain containing receptor kinase VIII.1-like n=1 Tax=Typha latifolia TaxID=4733 RepID=UPI003C2CB3C0
MEISFLALLALIFFSSSFHLCYSSEGGRLFHFAFDSFDKNRTSASNIALYGDAEVVGSALRVSSSGRIVYEEPIRFLGRNPGFSTSFSFSILGGGGFAFFLSPSSARIDLVDGIPPSVVIVGLEGNHVEIYVGSDLAVKSSDLVLNSGEKLHSWIDYNGTSGRLEVRVSKSRVLRPTDGLVSYPIDLSNVLWREEMLVGFSSWTGNFSKNNSLYSWAFEINHGAPYLMHSEPLDPNVFLVRPRESPSPAHAARNHSWVILIALVVAAAFGSMVTFFTLFVWFAVVARRPIAPEKYPVHPEEVVYEKIEQVKDAANAKS